MRKKTTHKWLQRIVGILLVLVVLILGGYWVLRIGFDKDILDRSGWNTTEEGLQYLNYDGQPLTGWQNIDGNLFYFAPPPWCYVNWLAGN